MKTTQLFLFVMTCSAIAPAFSQTAANGAGAPKATPEGADSAFVQKAGAAGMAEVELSTLAAHESDSQDVRNFAQKMVLAHTSNNDQLKLIAAHEKIAMPSALDPEHAQLRDRLRSLHGGEFDRTYIEAMRADHQKMLDLLQSSGATVDTEELRNFIKQTEPVVQDHLRMAQSLKSG